MLKNKIPMLQLLEQYNCVPDEEYLIDLIDEIIQFVRTHGYSNELLVEFKKIQMPRKISAELEKKIIILKKFF